MRPTLQVSALRRQFPGAPRAALAGLTLDVHAGETLAVVGPSGCGKSTLLRLIAGLDEPDGGSLRLDGVELANVAPQQRDVAMVFQGFALYPHLSVRQNVEFPLRMRGVRGAEREARVREVAELLRLTPLLARYPAQLSGGEQQRVAIGRALVRRPKLFLFDEPLSNLDAALRAELRTELGRLLAQLGTAALYVTHDQVEAMTLGSRIAVLNGGALEQLGTPEAIYTAPASRFVATFIGSPPCAVLSAAHPALAPLAPTHAGPLEVAVRPEHVALEPSDTHTVRLPCRVLTVEPLGAETVLELDCGGEQRLRARVAGFRRLPLGSELPVFLAPSQLRWLDAETGRAFEASGAERPA